MKRRYLRIAIAGLIFLLALLLTLYPVISSLYNQEHQSQIQTAYREVLEQTDTSELERIRQEAIAYNAAITPGTVEEAYSQESIQMASEDYVNQLDLSGTGIMGYVEIPTIGVDLPIYHGTGNDSLDRGTGHLLGSSLPVGGESTHTIITGHSGMASQKIFTDLEQLQEGDVFFLHVLDEVLAYQVDAIHTVLPHDTTFLGIVPGQDLCTLVTCTPTGVNTHRLLVRGTRISYEPSIEAQNAEPEHEVATSSHWEDQYWFGIRLGVMAMVSIVLLVNAVLFIRKNGAKPNGEKETAMSESKRKIFFAILAVLLLLSGCIILLYPSLNGLWVDYTMRRNAEAFRSYVVLSQGVPEQEASHVVNPQPEPMQPQSQLPSEHPQLWLDMKAYNEDIFREGQESLSNPTAYE